MKKGLITKVLEAFAVGDAMGMPTEFMTRPQILKAFGCVDSLLAPNNTSLHPTLELGSVTDDTEQTLYILKEYCSKKEISVENTIYALLLWIQSTDAIAKNYIGPSSLAALQAIEKGASFEETGRKGTTCGGIMRSLAPTLCSWSLHSTTDELIKNTVLCLKATHNTSQAIEAASAYACATRSALEGKTIDEIIDSACLGARIGMESAPEISCGASSAKRIRYLQQNIKNFTDEDVLLDFLYEVFGTGLESADVCAAVFGIFLFAKGDVFKAIRMGASIGGDTDTIAALVGALCTAFAGHHNIPDEIVNKVTFINALDFATIEKEIIESF